jgi:monovalent cation:H+ antiporter-2, CPA2 family
MTLLLAADAMNDFLSQAAALLLAAAAIGYVSQRLRIVPIVGFLLAGVLIGPSALGLVRDLEVIELVAEIGIVLLLFTIGIEFSLERLARIRRYVLVGGGAKVLLAIALAAALLVPLGVAPRDAVFTGFLVAISSTAIVLKVLADRREVASGHGQVSLALLIFEDLAAVLMVLLIPILAGQGGPAEVVRVAVTAVVLIAAVLLVARRVMPRVLEAIARVCSPEVFLLSVIAICIGTAWLTNQAGVSVSLGAFLAGLIVSESRHGDHALGEVLPLQILFSAAFFLSIGMLLDVRFLLDRPLLVLAAVAIGLLIPLVTTLAATSLLRVGAATVLPASFLLAQVSEFAFVVERAGSAAGLSPAGLGEDGRQAFIAAVVLLMVVTPAMAGLGRRLVPVVAARTSARGARAAASAPAAGHAEHADGHVLISGWGPGAREVGAAVRAAGVPVTVITLSPDGAADAEAAGYEVHRGDSTKQHTLVEADLADARMLVIADDDAEAARRIAGVAAPLAPHVPIALRSLDDPDLAELAHAGVSHVVTGERTSRTALAAAVLGHLDGAGAPRAGGRTVVDTARLVRFTAAPEATCPHVGGIAPVLASAPGCEDCLRAGGDWVHLRLCLTCGHVGCCDSSPGQHARAHVGAEDHPIITSAEPGEDWVYCFSCDEAIPGAFAADAVRRRPEPPVAAV